MLKKLLVFCHADDKPISMLNQRSRGSVPDYYFIPDLSSFPHPFEQSDGEQSDGVASQA